VTMVLQPSAMQSTESPSTEPEQANDTANDGQER
jgi:hypothetical protein